MSYQGFGISSGPTFRPKSQPPFGSFDQPSSFPSPPIQPRPSDPRRDNEQKAVFNYDNAQTPPAAIPFSASPNFVPGVPFKIPQVQELKRTRSPNSISRTTTEDVNGRPSDIRWNNEKKPLINYNNNSQMLQRPSAAATFSDSHNFRPIIPHVQDVKRTILPSNNSRNISQDVNGSRFNSANNRSMPAIQRTRSPPLGNNHTAPNFDASIGENQGSFLSSPAWVNGPRSPCDYSDLLTSQDLSSASPFANPYESQNKIPSEHANGQLLKRTRSPPLPSGNEKSSYIAGNVIKRPSMSPPTLGNRSNVSFHSPGFEVHQSFSPSIHNGSAVAADTKPFPTPKRNRSPPVPAAEQTSNFTQDETERESQAKAKRLARFSVELSQPEPSSSDIIKQKFSRNRNDHPMDKVEKFTAENSMDIVGDLPNGSVVPEYEAPESSSVIIGLCPDMCPGSERAERERKGDLDQYERFDGDRNQTHKSLAVKKYTRTAEREANLIRPMPILQKTIDYLINLLEQPYDHTFLGMYNFLWDRMRAIRMDLRMQHIFNLGSIAMLEQMIRLHIIAMHELCEYTKGEGFSEGFDAHLNIEQMNKTSVELFQIYDDHRKKGINVPTEKEFRGYYALLKLDKHPGYKVDPAELSLDLAKMTPQIRQTPEVLFARNVARSCRTGNFIAFFRHARQASYLQACLMHAHFAKLRTQALASLHSGLQNNQGLPISTVARWFGMEEEDIEGLSDYHGFVLKEFEEPYMVKEGPFLNSDKDYPTKCSKLVHLKRSTRISEDVSSSGQVVSLPGENIKPQLEKVFKHDPPVIQMAETPIPTSVSDEDMIDPLVVVSPKADNQVQPSFTSSIFSQQSGNGHQVTNLAIPTWNHFSPFISPQSQPAKVSRVEKQNVETLFERPPKKSFSNAHTVTEKAMPLPKSPVRTMNELSPGPSKFDYVKENSVPQNADAVAVTAKDRDIGKPADIHQETEPEKAIECYHEEEALEAKLKLILRLWRRRSSKLKELREQRLAAANAALTLLSLGPSIRHKRVEPNTFGEFNIDSIMRERNEKHERSWSRLNVSDVIVDQMIKRNPDTKCLCFKLIVCSQTNDANGASSWLLSKLMPSTKDNTNNDLVTSLPGVSIWNKWLLGQSSTDLTCCMSIIKDANFDNLNETVSGASAVLFLVSENISWELQKTRLQSVLISLPPNSSLPLLILRDAYNTHVTSSTIIDRLGLSDFDKSRISGFLVENLQINPSDGFFSDERLREGLQWLASKSPSQPVLKYVKTRELVLNRLNSSLDMVSEMSIYDVAPHHCITAFNDALDISISEVAESASANPCSWPCSEINMLDDYSPEYRASKLYLPSIGWSSSAKIEPVICALNNCKLPAFSDDISWLGRGCNSMAEEEIEFQRSELENYIVRYMTKSSHMMDFMLATTEAHLLLQNNAGLELHDSSFYIVPNWVMIFRRIFNWRLSNLSTGDCSSVYICERESDIPSTSGRSRNNLNFEISASSPYRLMRPSLDELVDVGCSPFKSKRDDRPEPEVHTCPQNMVLNPEEKSMANSASESILNEINLRQCGGLNASSELTVNTIANKEADKLSKLLENCNILQNRIEKKLSVYF